MSNSGHHDCSTKAAFLCTAVKLQSCHMLVHWTQHTGPSPPFNQHSFKQQLWLFYEVLSFENSPWASLGRILALACATTEKHWCPVSAFACFRGRVFLGILYSSPCVAKLNKSVWSETRILSAIIRRCLSWRNSDCCMIILLRQLLGGAFAVGTNTMALIQTCQIQAIMTVSQRLSFSALSNCNVATSGFATKTIPQGAPLPTEHSKNYDSACDWL